MAVRAYFREAARRVAPAGLVRWRDRLHRARLRASLGVGFLAREFAERHGAVVRAGPVAGLRYPVDWLAEIDAPVAKLLGSYESEIGPLLTAALDEGPRVFVDIGAAEGYYAVGLALRLPSARVYAFEPDPVERRRCAAVAELNGVADRLLLRGACTRDILAALPLDGALVLSDCEGHETEIFVGHALTACRHATVIVELHGDDSAATLMGRFEPSHTVEIAEPRKRDPARFPELAHLDSERAALALSELRASSTVWGVFRPRTGSDAPLSHG